MGNLRRFANLPRPLLLLLIAAAAVYFFQLGRAGFDDAEAYSAYIASRPNLRAVFDASLQLDPGKGGSLYFFALHWYCEWFGTGEIALRAFSAGFALGDVMLVFALAAELFGVETALIAATLWAFNPIALIAARWARMYSMIIALTLGSLLAMRKVEQRPSALRIVTFGGLTAAMLYTHLGGPLMLGAEAAILIRDRWRGRAIVAGCLGIAIALIAFTPLAPAAFTQIQALVAGHRLDWIGSAHHTPLASKIIGSLVAAMLGLVVVFGPPMPFDHADANPLDDSEPMRWCAIWSILPVMALMVGALVLHPMFQIRYVAPVIAGFAILIAAALNFAGSRIRNLSALAIASTFLILAILYQTYHPPFALWRQVADAVEAARSPAQTVFFEAGYVMSLEQSAGLDSRSLVEVFPGGYLRIPFDYYFHGANPRRAINPFRPDLAREAISQAASRDGGAWLLSHMSDDDLARELPSAKDFVRLRVIYDESVSVSLYHFLPREHRQSEEH